MAIEIDGPYIYILFVNWITNWKLFLFQKWGITQILFLAEYS